VRKEKNLTVFWRIVGGVAFGGGGEKKWYRYRPKKSTIEVTRVVWTMTPKEIVKTMAKSRETKKW